jgi:hypothetical protein
MRTSGTSGMPIEVRQTNLVNLWWFAIANRPTEQENPIPTNSANTLIENSTIYGNKATAGGGITNTGSTLTLLNDTVDNNTSLLGIGAGVGTVGGTVNIFNTIVAGNFDGPVQLDLFNNGGTSTFSTA